MAGKDKIKTYLMRGEQTNSPHQEIKFRCVKERDMDYILKKLKLKRTDIKIHYEEANNPYNCEWKGLPEFKTHSDKWPFLKIRFNNVEDKKEFYKEIGKEYVKKNSDWFPQKPKYLPSNAYWDSLLPREEQMNQYPIFVISKGRYEKRRSRNI